MGLSDALVGDLRPGPKSEGQESTRIGTNETERALGLEGLLPDSSPAIETDDEDIRTELEPGARQARAA